jgi:hypothetical protein
VEADQVQLGSGHQGCQPLHELQRRQPCRPARGPKAIR